MNTDNRGIRKEICLAISSIHKKTMKKKTMFLKLEALPWLRNQMAEMLSKYDGTEQIAKDAPAQIPQKLFISGM